MTRSKTTKPVMNGGESCFNADGSWHPAVCAAIRHVKEKSDETVRNLVSLTKQRDALKEEIAEDGEDEKFSERCVKLVRTERKIEKARRERDDYIGAYASIIDLAEKNEFELDGDAKGMVRAAIDHMHEEAKAKKTDKAANDLPGQLTINSALASPSSNWQLQVQAFPNAFGDREWPLIKPHFEKLHEKASSPVKLARWLAAGFGEIKTSKDRAELLPSKPAWFIQGLIRILAAQAQGLCAQGIVDEETNAADMIVCFNRCATVDIDAWLSLCGGSESELNKLLLSKAAK